MTSAESGPNLIDYMMAVFSKEQQWPDHFPYYNEYIFLPDY